MRDKSMEEAQSCCWRNRHMGWKLPAKLVTKAEISVGLVGNVS